MTVRFPDCITKNSYNFGLAGCGKMGSAMLSSLLKAGVAGEDIHVLDPNDLPSEFQDRPDITWHQDAQEFMRHAEKWALLIVAIKPQVMDDFCADIAPAFPAALPILSIAAGKTISYFSHELGKNQPVIRAMPNTPAAIGKGITAACASPSVGAPALQAAHDVLSHLGPVCWTEDETLMDAVTAVSGSGPAYVFYLIETLEKAGIGAGLPDNMAAALARQTVIGAAALAEAEDKTPSAILRENVTSPGGTTEAALKILMDGRLQSLFDEAIAAAASRSRELSG